MKWYVDFKLSLNFNEIHTSDAVTNVKDMGNPFGRKRTLYRPFGQPTYCTFAIFFRENFLTILKP